MMEGERLNRGKIGRLPLKLRNELNTRLLDGQIGPTLLPWLNSLPEVRALLACGNYPDATITENNLSDWRLGSYRDWLERRQELEHKRELAQYCYELAQSGKDLLDGSASILGAKLMEVIESVDVEAQRGLLTDKPDSLMNLIGGLTKLQGQANQNYKLKQSDRRLALDELKFEGRFLKLFEKYYADRQVKEIMAGKDDAQVKMQQLRTHIFGARPAAEAHSPARQT